MIKSVRTIFRYAVVLASLGQAALTVHAPRAFGEEFTREDVLPPKAQMSVTPQFMILTVNGTRIQSYGIDFGAWYRLLNKADFGVSVRNFYSILKGGSTLLSTLSVATRVYLLGGDLSQTTKWMTNGKEFLVASDRPRRSLSLTASLEQASFIADGAPVPYSGAGVGISVNEPITSHQRASLGFAVDRLSNGIRILLPIRAELGWSVDLD